jgi:type I restriction enzyme M protein
VKAQAYNLDIKNPHTAPDDHGDPDKLLEALGAADDEAIDLREQLRAILAEALIR